MTSARRRFPASGLTTTSRGPERRPARHRVRRLRVPVLRGAERSARRAARCAECSVTSRCARAIRGPGRRRVRPRRRACRAGSGRCTTSCSPIRGGLRIPHLWARAEALGLDLDRFDDRPPQRRRQRAGQARLRLRSARRCRHDPDRCSPTARCTPARRRSQPRRRRSGSGAGVNPGSRSVNTDPWPVLDAVHRPPWAFAIASTIASPSPTPPLDRVRAASARAKRSKIRPSACSGMPRPSSLTLIAIVPPSARRGRSARSPRLSLVYFTAFSSSASSAARRRSGSTFSQPVGERSEPPRARRDLRPAHEHVLEERLELDLRELHELRLIGGGEHEQSLEDPVDAAELVERDVKLAEHLPISLRSNSRWPRAIVTGVLSSCEASWMNRSCRSSRERRSSARCSATFERRHATARVPDHGEEHRRHQRHLEQLAPELLAVERIERRSRSRSSSSRRRARSGSVFIAQTRKP